MVVTWLEPAAELPAVFPNPFDDVAPHALAVQCANVLMAELRLGFIAPGVPTTVLRRSDGGKMFGVLAVRDASGRIGFLKALSGQLERAWVVPGYVPPVFDAAARALVEPPAEVVVKSFTARVDAARADATLLATREEEQRVTAALDEERRALKTRHAANKAARKAARVGVEDPQALHAFDQLSRGDDAERRKHEKHAREALAEVEARLLPMERRLAALERLRRLVSNQAMRAIWDTYVLHNFAGETTPLRALFSGDPPSGAADCAAPRLLEAARSMQLEPLAMAEFWWGAPPPGGGRVEGAFFPSCREKCGPVLPFQLRGLNVAPKQKHRPAPVQTALEQVFTDATFVVVNKPAGLLSVPSRDEGVTDSVVARLRVAWPDAVPVHRLDLDTSGLLLVALNMDTYRALQAQFLERAVEKEYVAVLDGVLAGDEGEVALPLRLDVDHRPRQMVDFEHGKPAQTKWKVLSRSEQQTRVALQPVTGRTHQLRVHAAHPQGLGMPIVGDRLYGHEGERLLLHAQWLRFRHPVSGEVIEVRAAAPF